MYLTPTKSHWACDLEADNLLDEATRIWCVCVENVETREKKEFTDAESFREWLRDDYILVGHNFIAYDLVLLNTFWNAGIHISSVVDSFVLSQLYNPTINGGHSLESWGQRLKCPKGDFNDFTKYSKEMSEYCARDTSLTALLYRKLTCRMVSVGFTESGCEIEHLSWNIIQNKQRRHGFPFNKPKAEALLASLLHRKEQLENEIYTLWPSELLVVKSFKRRRLGNGADSAQYIRHKAQYPILKDRDDGGYDAYDFVTFNIGSPKQRIEKLLSLGWEPTRWTIDKETKQKKNPQVDEESLLAFAEKSGKKEVGAIAKWLVVASRANMIGTWLNAYNEKTSAIHGKLFIASTLRYRHSNPNSANIPAVRTERIDGKDVILMGEKGTWAYECRDLFFAGSDDYRLVGVDAKGIQIRILLNYAYSQEALDLYLHGDPHVRNAELLGLANKPAAKKFFYCVPMHTKALTKKGWKGYDEIEEGELVLTYNKDKNIQEWKPVLEKVFFEDAPLIEIKNKSFKIQCTPNHRWFTQQRKSKIKSQNATVDVKTTQELSTMQNIIINAPLKDSASELFINWMDLPKYGTDWTQVVLKMSQEERKAFLTGFCIADGYQDVNSNWRWSQLRGPLFEAALMASYLVHNGTITVTTRYQDNGNKIGTTLLGKKSYITTAFLKKTPVPNAPVWCIRTENDSWVMRQGDVITITGNTLIMGGAGKRLAEDQAQFGTKLSAKQGTEMKEKMIATIPGFKELIIRLENELARSGRITLCDGTPILVPSPHMVIPYLLQGDESRIMKKASILLDEEIQKEGLDARKVGDIHDEWQFVVRREAVPRFMEVALSVFPKTGEFFKYRVPIEGDAKEGLTWAETH